METLAAIDLGSIFNISCVVAGLTLVILFHELGHFAVAKWCDVQVERFSIGFGPVLLRYKRGETEYALSAIPFGGYVKMLGQDDADPSQMSAEEIAEDPRSYSAKSVLQRMAIISAGVIMNIVTGLLFFSFGFGLGVEEPAPVIGRVDVGMPAWKAGLEVGDVLTYVNGRKIEVFTDINRAVALSSSDSITVEGINRDGEAFKKTIQSDSTSSRPRIGIGPTLGVTVADHLPVTILGTAAAKAKPPFEPGDEMFRIDNKSISQFAELQELLARKREKTIRVMVHRRGQDEDVEISIGPRHFRTLGLWMGIGPISAVKQGSPAAQKGGLQQNDTIATIDGKVVGLEINPLQLPDYFADKHGEEVEMVIRRPVKGADSKELTIRLTPLDKPGWIERPGGGQPVSVPAIGIAFQLTSTVMHVVPGSPADGKIKEEERIQKMELVLPKDALSDGFEGKDKNKTITIDFDSKNDSETKSVHNWANAFWLMQAFPSRNVALYVKTPGEGNTDDSRPVELIPKAVDKNWYLPTRGIVLEMMMEDQKATNVIHAISMGWTHTKNNMSDIYLTLGSLFGGRISVKELHGPIGIATVAYRVANRGFADLLLFFGFLSVNLAVLNFLPIPVLDGGHMFFLIWEAVTRKKPSERILIAATYTGMAMILGLMALVLYLDIFVHWLPGQ